MDTAPKVLIVGGVAVMLYAFIIGFALSRARQGGAQASRYLVMTHLGGVMEGTALLALVFALALSDLSTKLESVVAFVLVGAAVAVTLGDTVLWRTRAEDAFVTKGAGFYLQGIGSTLWTIGLVILGFGVIRGL